MADLRRYHTERWCDRMSRMQTWLTTGRRGRGLNVMEAMGYFGEKELISMVGVLWVKSGLIFMKGFIGKGGR